MAAFSPLTSGGLGWDMQEKSHSLGLQDGGGYRSFPRGVSIATDEFDCLWNHAVCRNPTIQKMYYSTESCATKMRNTW